MSVIFIVLPLALLMALVAVAAFIWSTRSGQLDDLDSAAVRMLFDEDDGPTPEKSAGKGQQAEPRRDRNGP